MKKLISLLVLFAIIFSLCSCDSYVSSYKAIGLVRSNTSHSCKASFYSLEGHLVFKLKMSDAEDEGSISYSMRADSGEIRLYYDIYGVKEELARVKAGETLEGSGGYIEGGRTVYIIIEAEEKSGGLVSAELDK